MAKLVRESLNEAEKIGFEQEYFKLPYQMPEDRFEKGLIKDTHRRDVVPRILPKPDYSQLKYKSFEDFKNNYDLSEIKSIIKTDVKKVLDFLRNNPLTGKLSVKYNQESVEDYFKLLLEHPYGQGSESGPIAMINTNINFDWGISVDFDIYKNCPVYTFGVDSLFYYYTVFTLDRNDVTGTGEDYTYITSNDFIRQMFYETVWRQTLLVVEQNNYLDQFLKFLKLNEKEATFINKITHDSQQYLNLSVPIVSDYFNPQFKKFIRYLIKCQDIDETIDHFENMAGSNISKEEREMLRDHGKTIYDKNNEWFSARSNPRGSKYFQYIYFEWNGKYWQIKSVKNPRKDSAL